MDEQSNRFEFLVEIGTHRHLGISDTDKMVLQITVETINWSVGSTG